MGAPTLSDIALGLLPGSQGDSVSHTCTRMSQVSGAISALYVTFPPSIQSIDPTTSVPNLVGSVTVTSIVSSEQKDNNKSLSVTKDIPSTEIEQTVPYVDQTQREIPFIDFFISANPPVRVSTVYAGRMALLSERNQQMCLVKLVSIGELYGTTLYGVDKLTGEMYAVIDGTAKMIDLQAYAEEELEELEGAIGFAPTTTSTPKEPEAPGKDHTQGSKPLELSTIKEQTKASSVLTRREFGENRKKFRETPSISTADEFPWVIGTMYHNFLY